MLWAGAAVAAVSVAFTAWLLAPAATTTRPTAPATDIASNTTRIAPIAQAAPVAPPAVATPNTEHPDPAPKAPTVEPTLPPERSAATIDKPAHPLPPAMPKLTAFTLPSTDKPRSPPPREPSPRLVTPTAPTAPAVHDDVAKAPPAATPDPPTTARPTPTALPEAASPAVPVAALEPPLPSPASPVAVATTALVPSPSTTRDDAPRRLRDEQFAAAEDAWRRGDQAAAVELLKPLAAVGISRAQAMLARAHEAHTGRQPNYFEAYVWYSIAARGGEPGAASLKDKVAAKLQPAEIQQAERVVERWKPHADVTVSTP